MTGSINQVKLVRTSRGSPLLDHALFQASPVVSGPHTQECAAPSDDAQFRSDAFPRALDGLRRGGEGETHRGCRGPTRSDPVSAGGTPRPSCATASSLRGEGIHPLGGGIHPSQEREFTRQERKFSCQEGIHPSGEGIRPRIGASTLPLTRTHRPSLIDRPNINNMAEAASRQQAAAAPHQLIGRSSDTLLVVLIRFVREPFPPLRQGPRKRATERFRDGRL
eukprot:1180794-Prorocentrum_minimum.AAC.1